MYDETGGLRELLEYKAAELKTKALNDFDNGCHTSLPTMDSTFLGPILWEDTFTISDLDNINLDEFSPQMMDSSGSTISEQTGHSCGQISNEQTKVLELNPAPVAEANVTWTKDETFISESFLQVPTAVKPMQPTGNREQDVADVPQVTRKKSSVPLEERNEKYWRRRMKNNESAKRSRDARRMLENQVFVKAAELELENQQLKTDLNLLTSENKQLRELLRQANIPVPPPPNGHTSAKLDPFEDAPPYTQILPKSTGGPNSAYLSSTFNTHETRWNVLNECAHR